MEIGNEKLASVILFVAICLFTISSWIDLNGLFVELPLLVHALPEGWNLPSHLVVVIQIANIAPLCYLIIKKFKPNLVKEWIVSCIIIGVGILACFLLIFTWDKTSYIGGEMRSTALFSLIFFLSMVDCTTSVVYLPYMSTFKSPVFITAMYVGEGVGGLIPALVGFIQNFGMDLMNKQDINANGTNHMNVTSPYQPRFSISVYFSILTILLVVSLCSFLIINFNPYFDMLKIESARTTNKDINIGSRISERHKFNINLSEALQINPTNDFLETLAIENQVIITSNNDVKDLKYKKTLKMGWHEIIYYFLAMWINGLSYGFLPAIKSYSCLPYNYLTYDLSMKLSVLIDPLACFLTLFYSVRRFSVILVIAILGSLMSAYQVYLAVLSPNPIFKDEVIGIVLAVLSNVLAIAFFSYIRVCISSILSEIGGRRKLLYCGIFTQVGAFTGAVIGFLLVNVFKVFKTD